MQILNLVTPKLRDTFSRLWLPSLLRRAMSDMVSFLHASRTLDCRRHLRCTSKLISFVLLLNVRTSSSEMVHMLSEADGRAEGVVSWVSKTREESDRALKRVMIEKHQVVPLPSSKRFMQTCLLCCRHVCSRVILHHDSLCRAAFCCMIL